MEVSIIVLSVDKLEMTQRCIQLIKLYTPPIYELIIVCDKPSNKMRRWLTKMRKTRVKVITNKEPVGVPTALNKGIRIAEGKYICLVNNDIAVSKGWFEPLMEALQNHPEYGWVGSRIIRGDKIMNWGVISSALFSREAIDKIGLFDERFSQGIGWEDNDYQLRFRLAGYQPHGIHKSTVYHPPAPATIKEVHGKEMQKKYEMNWSLLMTKWGPLVKLMDFINVPYEGK